MKRLGKIAREELSDFDRMCGFDGKTSHPQFKTEVREVRYDFERQVGFVYMPPQCCTDMDGATSFFETIDPNVQMVVTIAGGELDTSYFKTDKLRCGTYWGAFAFQGRELRYSPSGLEHDEVQAAWRRLNALPEAWNPRPLRG